MSYWQAIAAIGQAYASRRNSRQLQAMSKNKFFSGSTTGQKIDKYGRLATQLSQIKENSRDQTTKGDEYIDSWRSKETGSQDEYIDSWRNNNG